jgi:amino acid transporter
MGRRRDRDDEGMRLVEPSEARDHGNDPDAVRMDREGGGRDGGRLGPNIDAEGRRMDGPREGTEGRGSSDSRGGDGPRSVREARAERESRSESREERGHQGAHRRGNDDQSAESDRGTSWLSVILGWLAALGAGLILSGIVGAVVGAILGGEGANSSATEGGTAGLIGLLITLLLAFIIGGYVAGRLASRSGLKHGLLVPVLMLVVTIVLAGIGALLGLSFLDNLSGVTLPSTPSDAPQGLSTILTGAGILALLMPFIGGAIGGALGARTGRRRP